MSNPDDQTILNTDWECFSVEAEFTIPFASNADPTEFYTQVITAFGSENAAKLAPFTDPNELFVASLELAAVFLPHRGTNDLYEAWTNILQTYLNGNTHTNERIGEADIEMLKCHAIRVAKTSPMIFGRCVELNQHDRRADFKLYPIQVAPQVNPDQAMERHDIFLWRACFHVLGKLFELDTWKCGYIESLIYEEDPAQPVFEIRYGTETIAVTRDAHQAMSQAMTGMSSRPPIYYNCKQVVTAIVKILGKELLSYTMPQSTDDLKAFDWNTVVVGDSSTYPKAPAPKPADFKKIRIVFLWEKDRKDKEAQDQGAPHAGVPSVITLRQRWKTWRDSHAVYRTMYPEETLQMIADRVTIALKASNSEANMEERITEDIRKYIQSRKRATKKREVEEKLKTTEQEEAAAKAKAEELQQQKARVDQEKQQLQSRVDTQFGRTRRAQQQGRKAAMDEIEKEAAETEKGINEANAEARKKEEEKQSLLQAKRKVEEEEVKSKVKRSRRNDTSRLDAAITPRRKAELDPTWKPPTLVGKKFEKPGAKWEEASTKKLALLSRLRAALATEHVLQQPMTFATVMEFLSLDDATSTFNDRVFIHLLCLMISQKSSFDSTIAILTKFVQDGLTDAEEVKNLTAVQVQEMISEEDSDNKVGATIHEVATNLHRAGGDVPTTKEGLTNLGLEDTVVCLLMQHVFGSRELVVDIHARKILTALDMVDWEEPGFTAKSDIKMVKLNGMKVKRSLLTWLPKGEAASFHDTMHSLGALLSSKTHGEWGKVKAAISRHFVPKEKEALFKMIESIRQFYKATTSGGRVTVHC